MRGMRRPNFWVVGVLVFCLTAWGISVLSVSNTAHIYTHRDRYGFRHDLVARARVHWHELKQVLGVEAQPVSTP